jgi:hypothetical protein
MHRPDRRWLLALVLTCGSLASHAQLNPPDPDWKEVQVPPPPPLRTEGLIPIDLPESSLRFGVDPVSISIGDDRIVRYVVVATSSRGAVNAFYEGIRCDAGQVRLYARHDPQRGWVPVVDGEWRSLHEAKSSRHSLVIARDGACLGAAPNRSTQQIVRDLGGHGNGDWRFWNN